MNKLMFSAFSLVLAMVISSALFAEDENKKETEGSAVKSGLYLNTSLGASVNPLGLALKADIYYRLPLVKKPGKLWRSTKIDMGVQEYLSPSFQRASAFVKIEPIAVFDVVAYAGYDYIYDLNNDTFGPGFLTFSSPDDPYDTDDRKAMDGDARGGFRMVVIPTFKIAFGPVAALYSFSIEYHDYNFDGYFYDPSTFILHEGEDIVYKHDAKLLYKFGPFNNIGTFRVGVNFTNLWVDSTDKNSMKIAGMAVYVPKWSFQGENLQPYFVTMMGSHIQDRYYKGKFYFALLMGVNYKMF